MLLALFGHAQRSKIEKVLFGDFQVLQKVFDEHIFIESEGPNEHSRSLSIISIDTLRLNISADNKYYINNFYLNVVRVIFKMAPINLKESKVKQMQSDTIDYYILNFNNTDYFRLFGFYNTDIKPIFVDNGENSYEIGLSGLKSLTENLIALKILTPIEASYFTNAILNNKREYPVELGKPCNILKYYFSEKEKYNANTIILPIAPLTPAKW